jgi:hypothetical protein
MGKDCPCRLEDHQQPEVEFTKISHDLSYGRLMICNKVELTNICTETILRTGSSALLKQLINIL